MILNGHFNQTYSRSVMTVKSTLHVIIAVMIFAITSSVGHSAIITPPPYQPLPAAVISDGPTQLSDVEELESFVDDFMNKAFDRHHLVGGVVSVVKDGELFFAKGYGYRDLENRLPVEADRTMFRIGSVSKLFTWTAVMQLVEQGLLDLDVDVNRYLSTFQIPDTYEQPITLRNIMTHSTGLDEWVVGGHFFTHDASYRMTLQTALEKYMPQRLRPPTQDFSSDRSSSYSNWATTLAGYIVEQVSGMAFNDYVERHIFTPLAMNHTTFLEPPERMFGENEIFPYAPDADGTMRRQAFEHASSFAPAGSGSSTAEDMAKFAIAHLNKSGVSEKRILGSDTTKMMHARYLALNPHTNGHALGFFEIYLNGRRIIEHTGGTVFFHSDLVIIPKENIAFFISFNTPSGRQARIEFKKAFMDRYFPAVIPEISPLADAGARDHHYTGFYRLAVSNGHTMDKLMAFGSEIEISRISPGRLLIDGYEGTSEHWEEVAPNIFRNQTDGTLATFTTDQRGRAIRFTGAETNNPLERLKWYETTRFQNWLIIVAGIIFVSFLPRACLRGGNFPQRLFTHVLIGSGVLIILAFTITGYWIHLNSSSLIFSTPLSLKAVTPLLWLSHILLITAFVLLIFIKFKRAASSWFMLHGAITIMACAVSLWSTRLWNLL